MNLRYIYIYIKSLLKFIMFKNLYAYILLIFPFLFMCVFQKEN